MPSREERDRGLVSYPQENLDSPFLDEELFVTETEAESEPHLSALQSESAFESAFEESPRTINNSEIYREEIGEDTEGSETESFLHEVSKHQDQELSQFLGQSVEEEFDEEIDEDAGYLLPSEWEGEGPKPKEMSCPRTITLKGRRLVIGQLQFSRRAKMDLIKYGALLDGPDQKFLGWSGNRLGYDEAHTAAVDPFRWDKLKSVIVSCEKIFIHKKKRSDKFEVIFITKDSRQKLERSLNDFRALGYTLITEQLAKTVYPQEGTLGIVSPRKEIHLVYYSTSLSSPKESSLAHELLGHMLLALQKAPFRAHFKEPAAEAKFGTIDITHNILDPFGNPFKGTVTEFLRKFIDRDFAKRHTPTQNVGPQLYQQAFQTFKTAFAKNATGKLNGRWSAPGEVYDQWEFISANHALAPPGTGSLTKQKIQDDLKGWYATLSADKQYVFLMLLHDVRNDRLDFRGSLASELLSTSKLEPPNGMRAPEFRSAEPQEIAKQNAETLEEIVPEYLGEQQKDSSGNEELFEEEATSEGGFSDYPEGLESDQLFLGEPEWESPFETETPAPEEEQPPLEQAELAFESEDAGFNDGFLEEELRVVKVWRRPPFPPQLKTAILARGVARMQTKDLLYWFIRPRQPNIWFRRLNADLLEIAREVDVTLEVFRELKPNLTFEEKRASIQMYLEIRHRTDLKTTPFWSAHVYSLRSPTVPEKLGVDVTKLLTAARVKGIPPGDVDKYFLLAYASFPSEIKRWMVPEDKIVLDRFGFNQDMLTNTHLAEIKRIAAVVADRESSSQPIRTIRLMGHTDPVGKGAYNIELGQRRAVAVRHRLPRAINDEKSGLASKIFFHVESLGEEAPVADNKTEDGREQNRRVEIYMSTLGKGYAVTGRLQRVNIEAVVQRGLRLLKEQHRVGVELTDGQTKRISCFLRRVLPEDADDRFVEARVVNDVFDTGRPRPEFAYLKDRLTPKGHFGPGVDDAAFVRRLRDLDGDIIAGLGKIDEKNRGIKGGVSLSDGIRELRAWIIERGKKDESVYSCYREIIGL